MRFFYIDPENFRFDAPKSAPHHILPFLDTLHERGLMQRGNFRLEFALFRKPRRLVACVDTPPESWGPLLSNCVAHQRPRPRARGPEGTAG